MKAATDLSTECFGGILQADAYGFYTALEFMALFSGCVTTHGCGLPDVKDHKKVRPGLVSHDYARRLAWTCVDAPVSPEACLDNGMPLERRKAISGLLKSLAVPVPGRRKESTWHNSHFLPYSSDLIHWDSRRKHSKILIERIYYRGAGAIAFRILRSDSDEQRRHRIESCLREILEAGSKSLREFLSLMKSQDAVRKIDDTATEDDIESQVEIRSDRYEALLCERVDRLLSHSGKVPGPTLINALMYILPLSIIRLQHGRSAAICEEDESWMGIVDCGYTSGQLRRESKRSLSASVQLIEKALQTAAEKEDEDAKVKTKTLKQFASYYTRTAAAIGLLNAPVGIRYFSLSDSLLESMVLAETDQADSTEIPFREFCRRLDSGWGLVIDRDSAAERGLLNRIDGAVFEDNAEFLASRMRQLGFLHEYSDQTRMVRYGS